jgi:hypothetical protein
MGRLIPAGTGFEWYRHVRIPADEPPPPPAPPQPTEEEMDLDREIEYAFEVEETVSGRLALRFESLLRDNQSSVMAVLLQPFRCLAVK